MTPHQETRLKQIMVFWIFVASLSISVNLLVEVKINQNEYFYKKGFSDLRRAEEVLAFNRTNTFFMGPENREREYSPGESKWVRSHEPRRWEEDVCVGCR